MAKKKKEQHTFGGGINSFNPTPSQGDDLHRYYGPGNGGYGGPEIWGPSPFANEPGRGDGYHPNGYFPPQEKAKGRGSNGARNVKPPKKK